MRYERNVHIYDAKLDAHSDRLDADVDNPGAGGDTSQVSHLVMIGHVVGHKENEDATAGRAIYDGISGDWTLLEQPIVTQDGQTVTGSRIVIDGKSGRATAKDATATIPESERDAGQTKGGE
jgi:lipopolysaccharide export system protein LptA